MGVWVYGSKEFTPRVPTPIHRYAHTPTLGKERPPMSVDRITHVNELLKREIGDLLFRVMHADGFDLASVTITRVETSKDLREARVYVSILGHETERPRMLALLSRRRGEIQHRINKDVTLKYTPRLT